MHCPFCGLEIPDHASVCVHCSTGINLPAELSEGDIKKLRRRYNERFGIKTMSADDALKVQKISSVIPAMMSSRFIAAMFDWGILVGLAFFIMEQTEQVRELIPLLFPLAAFLYFSFMNTLIGRTIGKMIVGIRVTGSDNITPPTLLQSMLRSVVSVISVLFFFAGVTAPAFNSMGQSWHDMLTGTYVIYRR